METKIFTINDAIRCAINEAKAKIKTGKLFKMDVDLSEQNDEDGDPENIYTLSSMYANLVDGLSNTPVNIAVDKIENALIAKFPDYA